MAEFQNDIYHFKRLAKSLQTQVQELKEDNEILEKIRNNGMVFDSIMFYMYQPHVKEHDREKLREIMAGLARGGGQ